MSKLTQGTHIYFVDDSGSTPEVVRLTKVVALNPGTAPAAQINETTLEDLLYRQYRAGLRDPGQGNMTANVDPNEDSHVALHGLSETSPPPTIKWAVGWSDGTDAPTLDSSGEWDLPTTRTWCTYDAYVADFPFDFQTDTIVLTEITIQRAGGLAWQRKA
ncbi:hypothetical protein MKP05_09400 [Halomonas sp. EGI 63088]|uniref:Phage tail protein n=1 Tax=Halomonas flagellata TaxID=2920385 RepID=A0ABS9RU20_9GAMM|nr:phage tail tube protein [Halomonas flagellata]MCH4563344.1 hypothetical protein [Halomonas flagellata]